VPRIIRVALLVQTGLLLAAPLAAQVKYGLFSSNLSGMLSSGYTAQFGNQGASNHNWSVGGTANLTGNYYKPSFVSYAGTLYVDQSRANSDFQSISDASGFSVSTNIFGGSRFPGSVSYSKGFNSDGNYGLPGVSNYVTHGDNDEFAVSWSLNLPKLPTLTAGLQLGNNQYSVYGTNNQGNSAFHSFNLRSTYLIDGFNSSAYYSQGGNHSLVPQIVSGQSGLEIRSDFNGFGFGVSHRLPLEGSISGNINRSSWNTTYQGTNSTGTIDTANMFASIHPTEKLNISGNLQYSDNLAGQLIQAVAGSGGVASGVNVDQTSNSLDMQSIANYIATRDLQTSIFVERRSQLFEGTDYGVDSYGGNATYTHRTREGTINASLTMSGNRSEQDGEDTLGLSASGNYSNEIDGWHVNAAFGYAQNMQTLLVTYLNSSYNFSGNARRRFGKFSMSAGAGGNRTALTDQPGTSSSSQSYNASVGYSSWISANGSYSESSGLALATGAGLVPVPVPSPILPSNLVTLYGGRSYSWGVSSAPAKGLTFSTSFSRADSSTSSSSISSSNQTEEYNSLLQYRVRKLGFVSGYARLQQSFSQSSTAPAEISTFYFGVSRWFNFF
jgi:hypothetical protein